MSHTRRRRLLDAQDLLRSYGTSLGKDPNEDEITGSLRSADYSARIRKDTTARLAARSRVDGPARLRPRPGGGGLKLFSHLAVDHNRVRRLQNV